MTALLVTGTGTGIGKTVVTAAAAALALGRHDRCTVLKHTCEMTTAASTAVIRQWARDLGIVVGDRGRLAPAIVSAYEDQRKGESQETASSKEAVVGTPAAPSGTFRISARPVAGATGTRRRVRAAAS